MSIKCDFLKVRLCRKVGLMLRARKTGGMCLKRLAPSAWLPSTTAASFQINLTGRLELAEHRS